MSIEDDIAFLERVPTLRLLGRTALRILAIGAESRYGPDKSMKAFGEYQIDAINTGGMNRAIMGLGKRFQIAPGLTIDAGYERQQTFAGALLPVAGPLSNSQGVTSRDAVSVAAEILRSDRVKVTTRQEVRLDQGDPTQNGVRKLQFLSLNQGQIGLTRELALFGRANWSKTTDQTRDQTEAEALETTLGFALRPLAHNWFNVIGKATYLVEQRPLTDVAASAAVRKTIVTREEHDRIFRAYHSGNMTQAELAARFGRSKSAICAIVNRYHKFSSTHDQKTD